MAPTSERVESSGKVEGRERLKIQPEMSSAIPAAGRRARNDEERTCAVN